MLIFIFYLSFNCSPSLALLCVVLKAFVKLKCTRRWNFFLFAYLFCWISQKSFENEGFWGTWDSFDFSLLIYISFRLKFLSFRNHLDNLFCHSISADSPKFNNAIFERGIFVTLFNKFCPHCILEWISIKIPFFTNTFFAHMKTATNNNY